MVEQEAVKNSTGEEIGHQHHPLAMDTMIRMESITRGEILDSGSSRCILKTTGWLTILVLKTATMPQSLKKIRITLRDSLLVDRPLSRGIWEKDSIRSQELIPESMIIEILEIMAAFSMDKTIALFLTTKTQALWLLQMWAMEAELNYKTSLSRSWWWNLASSVLEGSKMIPSTDRVAVLLTFMKRLVSMQVTIRKQWAIDRLRTIEDKVLRHFLRIMETPILCHLQTSNLRLLLKDVALEAEIVVGSLLEIIMKKIRIKAANLRVNSL